MAVTTIDPKTALIVIDLQNGIVALPAVHPAGEVVKYASALADAFRRHGLPVVLVSVAGAPSGRTERARSSAMTARGSTSANGIIGGCSVSTNAATSFVRSICPIKSADSATPTALSIS